VIRSAIPRFLVSAVAVTALLCDLVQAAPANAANILFVAFSRVHAEWDGHVFVFFVMTVAAAEAAVALAIIIALFRQKESVDVESVDAMRG